jgi:hypothetical protein
MASDWTNRGIFNALNCYFKNATEPTYFYAVLITSASAPTADTNTFSGLTEIAATNGYTTGGIQITRDATGFPTTSEDDSGDKADFTIKNLVWTASGGSLPVSGSGARYCVITDDNATLASREIIGWIDLGSDRTLTVGQSLTVSGSIIRISN